MSFSSDVKEELTRVEPGCSHCERALLAAIIRIEGTLFFSGKDRYRLEVVTDAPYVARLTWRLLHETYNLKTELTTRRSVLHKTPNYLIGVPAQAILKEDRAMQSMENAAFSAQVLNDQGITPTRAILCCQAFHARRSFLSYSKFFPETEILVIPVSTQDIRREDWFMSKKSYQKVMSEVAKCGKYFMDFE